MKKILSLLSICLALQHYSFSQNQASIDTLLAQLNYYNTKKAELDIKSPSLYDTAAIKLLVELSTEYWYSNPDSALYYANQGLTLSEQIDFKKGIGHAYNSMAVTYFLKSDYLSSLEFHKKALKNSEESGSKMNAAVSLNNIGNVYQYMGNYPEALNSFFTCLKTFEEIGDKNSIATIYTNIGLVYTKQDDYPEALKNHFAALKLFEEIGSKDGLVTCCIGIGLVKLKTHQAKEGKDWLLKGMRTAKEIEAVPHIKDIYALLAVADSTLGNFKGAYENYKSYIFYRDSIESREHTKKTVALQMNYDFSKKQDSLSLVQANKDIAAQKELNKQILLRNRFIGGTILFLLLAGAAIRFYIDRMQRNRKKQMEAVRARISRDLHDDMGSTLQSISVMSEIARIKSSSDSNQASIPFLEKIGSASRDMVDKMNDIVWAVNPQNDDFENIILHMRAFGGELLAGKDIALHFKTDGSLNDIRLPMEKRRSFFLVYKEALNNAFKYSGAKNVNVNISRTNHTLTLVVEDDGAGFDMNEDRLITGGNGLKNMNTRAAELNGSISITSAPGQGTRVYLTVNLSN